MAEITVAKDLERAIKKEMELRQPRQPMIFERIVDSAAAGNIIGRTPADFYLLHSGKFSYIEAKFSSTTETLRSGFSSLVKSHQLASARLVARAGGNYWIIFYSGVSKRFELWDGLYCAEQKSKGKPLSLAARKLVAIDLAEVFDKITILSRGIKD